jgi:hypothetical protein
MKKKAILFAAVAACLVSVSLAGEPKLPDLLPARGELPPTYWELHGLVIVGLSAAGVAVLGLLAFWISRPRPPVSVPPDVVARRALEALRGQPEDGVLLMRVSAILRHYLVQACRFPAGERTTTELCQELQLRADLDGGLLEAIAIFLRRCDERKFAPTPPPAAAPVVDNALDLVAKIESRSRRAPAATPPLIPPAAGLAPTPG